MAIQEITSTHPQKACLMTRFKLPSANNSCLSFS